MWDRGVFPDLQVVDATARRHASCFQDAAGDR
jgi:hypothetical protein